jgi:hypothetical protein
LITQRCIIITGSKAEKGISPFSGVLIGIAAIGRWEDGLRYGQERKAGENYERYEK